MPFGVASFGLMMRPQPVTKRLSRHFVRQKSVKRRKKTKKYLSDKNY